VLTVEATKDILTGGLALATAGCAAAVLTVVARRRSLLPLDRRGRRVTWGAAEIILAFLAMVLIQSTVLLALDHSPLLRSLYELDVIPAEGPVSQRAALWAGVLSTPTVLGAVFGILWAVRRTPPRLVGARAWRWPENIALGFLAWIILTPFVFAIHYGVRYLHERVFQLPPQLHPLEQIFRGDALPVEWILLVVQAVVLAPLLEELLFRGLLLPWLAKGPARSAFAWLGALILALAAFVGQERAEALSEVSFVLGVGLVGAVATKGETGPEWRWRGILGSSLLFAMFHAGAWPSPVPLFFLALGLGWLAQRTGSLVGPIVLHALFNMVSTLMLLRGWDV
jgi:membrane protease YdiL (CAAX protease family)